jgi:acyl-CoA thioesterase I
VSLKLEDEELIVELVAPLNFDYNKAETGTVSVSVPGGDREQLAVTEVSENSPRLAGRIKLARGADPVPGDGVLQLRRGDRVEAAYGYGYMGTRASAAAPGAEETGDGDRRSPGGKTFVGYRDMLIPELRRKQVKVEFIGPHRDATSAHAGYSNKNAGDLRSMIKEVYSQYPADIVLLHAGHNNFSERKPVPGAIRDTEAILRTIWTINPKAVILLAQVIPSGKLPKYSYIPELNVELAALADRLAAEGRTIVLVNQAEGFDWKTDTIGDPVHPNASGAKKMADQWMAALLPILENHEIRDGREHGTQAVPTGAPSLCAPAPLRENLNNGWRGYRGRGG